MADRNLSHTFRDRKLEMIRNQKSAQDYVNDLEETWLLNIDLFGKMIYQVDHDGSLENKLRFFKELYFRKQSLIVKKEGATAKLLVNQQIQEEIKRNQDLVAKEREELIKEMMENIANKDSGMKEYFDKFKEVDIYLEKQIKLNRQPSFKDLAWFRTKEFINLNTELKWNKLALESEIYRNVSQSKALGHRNKAIFTERLMTYDIQDEQEISRKSKATVTNLKKQIEEKKQTKKQLLKQLKELENKMEKQKSMTQLMMSPIIKNRRDSNALGLVNAFGLGNLNETIVSREEESKFDFSILKHAKEDGFGVLNKDDWDVSMID